MIAGGSWLAMIVVGLDNALFWAFLIFLASYIPIIGGFVGIVFPALFGLVQFDTLWQGFVLLGVLYGIQFVVGNIITPRMQGDSLNIDPVVVLLALALWGAIWGLPGMFLSTPLAVMAMTGAAPMAALVGSLPVMAGSPGWLADLQRETRRLLESGDTEVWDTLTRQFEGQLIHTALEITRGRRIEAAHRLGIGRNTITRKIQELGLED